jgi:hypothetical protein
MGAIMFRSILLATLLVLINTVCFAESNPRSLWVCIGAGRNKDSAIVRVDGKNTYSVERGKCIAIPLDGKSDIQVTANTGISDYYSQILSPGHTYTVCYPRSSGRRSYVTGGHSPQLSECLR